MRVALLALALLAAAAPAVAQYYNSLSGRQFNNIYALDADRIMSQMVQNAGYQTMRASIQSQATGKAPAAGASKPVEAGKAKAPLAVSDFKPAGARRVPEQIAEQASGVKERAELVAAAREIHKAIEATPFVVVGGFIAGIAQAGQESGNDQLKAQACAMARDALAQFGVKAA